MLPEKICISYQKYYFCVVKHKTFNMNKKILFFFVTFLSLSVFAKAQDKNHFEKIDKSVVKSGFLYDKVKLPFSEIEKFSKKNSEYIAKPLIWRELYGEIKQASLEKTKYPDVVSLKNSIKPDIRKNIFPVGILNFQYQKIKEDALKKGLVKIENDQVIISGKNALETKNLFAVSPVDTKKYTGKELVFDFSSKYYFSDYESKVDIIKANFDDGKGFVTLKQDDKIFVKYKTDGVKKVKIELTLKSGEKFESGFDLKVSTPKMPTPSETWTDYTADISYLGTAAQGEVGVFFGNGNTDFTRPVIIVDGFDPGDTRDLAGLWDIANQQNMVDSLLAEGYDFVIANFYGGDDYIQRNAMLVVKLIRDINARMTAAGTMKPANQIAVIGPSMGGLITRYAIRYCEQNGIDHNVRNWISFDSPMKGADIPLGLQHWVKFFAEEAENAGAQEALASLSGPAAKQMLIYHYTATSGNTANNNALFTSFYNEINAMGFPEQTRIVSIVNGSGYGNGQPFAPGEQVIFYSYRSWLVDLDGNVWAVPDQTNTRIFNGLYDTALPFDEVNENIYVNNTLPYDGAPGGSRNTFAEMDAIDPGYGDIVAPYPAHAFIPSISALCIQNTVDPYYNVDANISSVLTPFDKLYYPSENQDHVAITPESYNWFYHEVINFAPQFTSTPVTSVNEDSQYSYTLSATDENEWNTFTYELIEKPDWMSFNASTGEFSGTPLNEDVGDYAVSVKVTDGLDESIQTFTVTVVNTNDAPVFTSTPVETATEDSEYSYTVTASDEDPTNDALTFSAVDIPSWLNFDASSGILSGTPLNEDVGDNTVTLSVNDGTVDVNQTFTVTVANTNDAPVYNQNLQDREVIVGNEMNYTFPENCFEDIDEGDNLTYSATSEDGSDLPSWLNFNPESRTFSGTPSEEQIINIKVIASDDSSATAEGVFKITVSSASAVSDVSGEGISIFPNPVKDALYIEFNDNYDILFDIYDVNGKKMLSGDKSVLSDFIDLSGLSAGIYILKLRYAGKTVFRKLVKQ